MATTTLILDTRYATKTKKYPVRLRITHDRKRYYVATGKSYSEVDWKRLQSEKPGSLKQDKTELYAQEKKAIDIIEKMPRFTIDLFKKKFQTEEVEASLKQAFKNHIQSLKEDQVKTASNYQGALDSFESFRPNALLAEVTEEWLAAYEKHMLLNERSNTTISMYCRALRAVLNRLIKKDKSFPAEYYPFGKHRYEIPQGDPKKLRLTESELSKIIAFQSDVEIIQKAKDMWLFTYYAAGMNPIDMCKLTYGNIVGNSIHFYRTKTRRTTKQRPILIKVPLHSGLKEIIKKWGQEAQNSETHIFPVLHSGVSPIDERRLVDMFIHNTNDQLRRIKKELALPWLTFGVARCTQANMQRDHGIPYHVIQANMGHASIKTTENYFGLVAESETNDALNKLYVSHIKTA